MMYPGAVLLWPSCSPITASHKLASEPWQSGLAILGCPHRLAWSSATYPLPYQGDELRIMELNSMGRGTCWDCRCSQSKSYWRYKCQICSEYQVLELTFLDSLQNRRNLRVESLQNSIRAMPCFHASKKSSSRRICHHLCMSSWVQYVINAMVGAQPPTVWLEGNSLKESGGCNYVRNWYVTMMEFTWNLPW